MKQGLSKQNKKLVILIIVGVALVIGILTVVNALRPKPEVIARVGAVTVEKGDVKELLDLTGTVRSMNAKTFFSPVNAKISEMDFEMGDSVQKGTQLVSFDLKDLEENNKKAEMNVQSGQLDYQDAINQDQKNANKKAAAQANANTLQGAVDKWQAYVNNLKDAINQTNIDAQNKAIADANSAAAGQSQAIKEGQAAYQQALADYNSTCDSLYADYQNKFADAQIATNEYEMAFASWSVDQASEEKAQALNSANTKKIKAENAMKQSKQAYDVKVNEKPQIDDYVPAGGSYDGAGNVTPDTYELQKELENASTYLAELRGELASEEAIAKNDIGGLTSETKEKMKIGTNLAELESKSIEELIAEGRKGLQAEFTGVISGVVIQEGATVSQGMELFTLQSTEAVSVDVKISKHDYAKVKEGQKATITMAGNEYEGTVTKIDRIAVVDAQGNSTIKATVNIDNPDENIFIGVEAKVIIRANEANGVLVVPSKVVNIGKDGSFCYVIKEGVIVKQIVETGVASTNSIEIKSGLTEGDQVIEDIGNFVEGDKVEGVEPEELIAPATEAMMSTNY